MGALTVLLVALASARTYRLLAVDSITQRIRDVLTVHVFQRWPKLEEGYYCPWCLGAYCAAAWTATALAWGATWPWMLAAVSFSANYVAAFLNSAYDVVHEEAEEALND